MELPKPSAYDGVAICLRCIELRGAPKATPELEELCDCTPLEVRRERDWPRFDYPQQFELCRCCGIEVLRSGTKWSVWFCRPCQLRVGELNDTIGRYMIPIGRHSLMGGVGISGADLKSDSEVELSALAERFADALGGIIAGGDRLTEWRAVRVRSNVERLKLSSATDQVDLRDYIVRAKRARLSKPAAFRGLVEFWSAA